jgi:hypothetical protein
MGWGKGRRLQPLLVRTTPNNTMDSHNATLTNAELRTVFHSRFGKTTGISVV